MSEAIPGASRLSRRRFLGTASAALATSAMPFAVIGQGAPYVVGVGRDADPYAAARRAVLAGGWDPSQVAGRRVIIKLNLVGADPWWTGTSTHPEAIRALVDLALDAGASDVRLLEEGRYLEALGFQEFETYDPLGRVSVVDLLSQPLSLARISPPLAYSKLYLPALLFEPDVYLITAAKLKVHVLSAVTLALKNQFGLPPPSVYAREGRPGGRHSMHDRSVNETIIDINRARPVDFALVDGGIAMDVTGPLGGVPVRLDTMVAGANALAVDQVCLFAMSIPVARVQHLLLARQLGLGPATLAEIDLQGDTLAPRSFTLPDTLGANAGYPSVTPRFLASGGQPALISYNIEAPTVARVSVVQVSPDGASMQAIRTLKDWQVVDAGAQAPITWDGRDEAGTPVPAGEYGVHVSTYDLDSGRNMNSIGLLGVLG